jgi:hypothetical protein
MFLALGDPVRALPGEFSGETPPGARRVEVFSPGCLVVEGEAYAGNEGLPDAIARCESVRDWPLIVLVDDAAEATASTELFLWTAFTRFEPAADLSGREKREARFHVGLTPPVVIDARMKPWYPEVMAVDEPTKDLVDRRWAEYGIPD